MQNRFNSGVLKQLDHNSRKALRVGIAELGNPHSQYRNYEHLTFFQPDGWVNWLGYASILGWRNPTREFNHFTHPCTDEDVNYIKAEMMDFGRSLGAALDQSLQRPTFDRSVRFTKE